MATKVFSHQNLVQLQKALSSLLEEFCHVMNDDKTVVDSRDAMERISKVVRCLCDKAKKINICFR